MKGASIVQINSQSNIDVNNIIDKLQSLRAGDKIYIDDGVSKKLIKQKVMLASRLETADQVVYALIEMQPGFRTKVCNFFFSLLQLVLRFALLLPISAALCFIGGNTNATESMFAWFFNGMIPSAKYSLGLSEEEEYELMRKAAALHCFDRRACMKRLRDGNYFSTTKEKSCSWNGCFCKALNPCCWKNTLVGGCVAVPLNLRTCVKQACIGDAGTATKYAEDKSHNKLPN